MKKLILLLCIASVMSCKNENKVTETQVVNESEITEENQSSSNELKFDASKTVLKWSAYKTPEKVAVHGSFDSIAVNNTQESPIAEEVLSGADFRIETSSMTTGDTSRDAKIIGLYFNNLSSPTITGKFGKFENQSVPVTINMNNVEINKNFSYTFENKKIIITGVVDMLEDFKSESAFNFLHEACAELHMNKTWTDVSIEIISDLGN
ncbi:MAG: YceI family protein [Flavobacteriaceae bacterium]|nr:YceI family protein [Flavobacteriaceae bacterium]